MLVHAALHHHVDFHRRQARRIRGLDAFEHLGHREVGIVHRHESRIVQCVQAHGDTAQARVLERARFSREQGRIGREREFDAFAVGQCERGQHFDQALDVPAQQRFAASEADFLDAVIHEYLRQARDLLERQQLAVRQVRVVLAEHFLGHAIDTTEIAAVRDRDAQVAKGTA